MKQEEKALHSYHSAETSTDYSYTHKNKHIGAPKACILPRNSSVCLIKCAHIPTLMQHSKDHRHYISVERHFCVKSPETFNTAVGKPAHTFCVEGNRVKRRAHRTAVPSRRKGENFRDGWGTGHTYIPGLWLHMYWLASTYPTCLLFCFLSPCG